MGRGRNRKPRDFATFRLCPRPGAADGSDRVFVRVDGNPYSVPGFADDDGVIPSSSSAAGGDEINPSSSSSAAGGALPEHVHREIRPSLSSSGGGGSSAAFIPSRRAARFGLPLSVKAYDARLVVVGPDEVAAAAAVRPIEEAIDLDVAELLEESDVPPGTPEDEGLEEDFVIIANQPEEEQMDVEEDFVILANQPDEEEHMNMKEERLEDAWSKEGVPWLPDEQIEMVSRRIG